LQKGCGRVGGGWQRVRRRSQKLPRRDHPCLYQPYTTNSISLYRIPAQAPALRQLWTVDCSLARGGTLVYTQPALSRMLKHLIPPTQLCPADAWCPQQPQEQWDGSTQATVPVWLRCCWWQVRFGVSGGTALLFCVHYSARSYNPAALFQLPAFPSVQLQLVVAVSLALAYGVTNKASPSPPCLWNPAPTSLPAHTVAHAAAQCTYARVPTEKQNFGIYLGKPPANAVRTVMAGKRVKATIRSHCFKLTNNAMRGESCAAMLSLPGWRLLY